jgi:hypothetical protein
MITAALILALDARLNPGSTSRYHADYENVDDARAAEALLREQNVKFQTMRVGSWYIIEFWEAQS